MAEQEQDDTNTPNIYQFSIGWITALPIEYLASIEMLDEEYNAASISKAGEDRNIYKLGRIGEHSIVMPIPPAGTYGLLNAAKVAGDMKSSFPCIRVVLMVGLAGGAPSEKNDVRLGDVIVGTNAIPYAIGEATEHGLQVNGRRKESPFLLRSQITLVFEKLQRGLSLEQAIARVIGRSTAARKKFRRPNQRTDRLFKSRYRHGRRCECQRPHTYASRNLIHRRPREEGDRVKVHHGNVASADRVMKSARIRDELRREHDVLCFEMESIGIMDWFDCLPIRGICDYSDGHKNDSWHGYASLSAAVYAKVLLSTIRPDELYHGNLQVAQEEMERFVSDGFRGIK